MPTGQLMRSKDDRMIAGVCGGIAGALLALAAGWWGLREVLNRPVMQTLRQAADV